MEVAQVPKVAIYTKLPLSDSSRAAAVMSRRVV